jgi:hypothetical protein
MHRHILARRYWRLLNHHWWRDHRSLLQPFEFQLALLVGCALPWGDFVQGAPLRLHPHVRVPGEHRARDLPGYAHDHLVAGARLRSFRDQGMAAEFAVGPVAKILETVLVRRICTKSVKRVVSYAVLSRLCSPASSRGLQPRPFCCIQSEEASHLLRWLVGSCCHLEPAAASLSAAPFSFRAGPIA